MPQILPGLIGVAAGGAIGSAVGGTLFGLTAVQIGQTVGLAVANYAFAAANRPRPRAQASGVSISQADALPAALLLYGRTRVGGDWIAQDVRDWDGRQNGEYHAVLALAAHEIDAVEEVYLERELVWSLAQYQADATAGTGDSNLWGLTDSPFAEYLVVKPYLGTAAQEAEPLFVAASPEWSATSRLTGVAYIYFRFRWAEVWQSAGIPNPSAVVRGRKVFDPRDDSTAWSSNPALIARDYCALAQSLGGLGLAAAEQPSEAEVTALANICDESVSLAGGGTESRWAFDGHLDTAATPAENLGHLAASWGGWWTFDQGRIRFGGAAWAGSVASIDADWYADTPESTRGVAMESRANAVAGVIRDREDFWIARDLTPRSSATFRSEDGGAELIADLGELRGTTSHTRGQRLLKKALLLKRRLESCRLVLNLRARDLQVGDVVAVTDTLLAYSAKTFEVIGVTRSLRVGEDNIRPVIVLDLIETTAALYSWESSEEQARPAGGAPNLPSPFAGPVVDAPSVTEELYETREGGGVKARVRLAASSDSPFVQAWQFASRAPAEAQADAELRAVVTQPFDRLDDFAPGSYRFGVRAQNDRGLWGPWSWSGTVPVSGLSAPPSGLGGLEVQAVGGAAQLRWNLVPELDVRIGGRIEFRHSAATSGATWQTAVTIGKAVSGNITQTALPLLPGTYLARAFDAGGTPGPVASVATRAALLTPVSTVATVTESPGFTGTKTRCAVASSSLVLDAGETTAIYDFASRIDLSTVRAVRLRRAITLSIEDRAATFWSPSGSPFWSPGAAPFWAGGYAEGDAGIWVRETDDDPAGTPTWSAWQRLDAAEFEARAFEFQLRLEAISTDYVISVSALTVTAEEAS